MLTANFFKNLSIFKSWTFWNEEWLIYHRKSYPSLKKNYVPKTKKTKKKKINLKNPQELFKATGPVDWVISKSFSVDALF